MKYFFFLFLLIAVMQSQAQQTPARLPSLLHGIDAQTPLLHANEDPEKIIRKNVFVRATVNKKTTFVGEPLLVQFKLYTALSNQARVTRQPSFNSCSVMELSSAKDADQETIKGTNFHVFTIRKVQLTPLKEGVLNLGQAFVENVVQLLHANTYRSESFTTTLSNDPLYIDVKPLPQKGKPENFYTLVGDFKISAKVDSNLASEGDDITLQVTIEGSGDISSINAPVIHWPAGTEHFEGSDSQHIDQDNFPVSGYKIFKIPFIGGKEGKVTIPPVSLSFFDVSDESYKTVKTDSIPVTFTKAIVRQNQLNEIVTEDVSNKKYLWIIAAIAAAVILVLVITSGSKNRLTKAKALSIEKEKAAPIEKEEPVFEDKTAEIFTELHKLGLNIAAFDFWPNAKALLTKALQYKFGIADTFAQHPFAVLQNDNEYTAITKVCEHVYESCNRNLYSPETNEEIRDEIYFDLTTVVKKLYNKV